MEHNDVKQVLVSCPDLAVLDESSIALLLWRAQQLTLPAGTTIYAEGAPSDDTFCLLLSGSLSVDRDSVVIGEICDQRIFGEMAYFSTVHTRTATVRVNSPEVSILKFQLNAAELASPPFLALKRYFGRQAWDRFVSNSQTLPFISSPLSSNSASWPATDRPEPTR